MHFHPFGIPVDEFLVAGINALQVPPVYYMEMARRVLMRLRARLRR